MLPDLPVVQLLAALSLSKASVRASPKLAVTNPFAFWSFWMEMDDKVDVTRNYRRRWFGLWMKRPCRQRKGAGFAALSHSSPVFISRLSYVISRASITVELTPAFAFAVEFGGSIRDGVLLAHTRTCVLGTPQRLLHLYLRPCRRRRRSRVGWRDASVEETIEDSVEESSKRR